MESLPWVGASVAVLLLMASTWVILRRRPKRSLPLPAEWPLTPRPVFSTEERRVNRLLREAFPHHIVLSKLPLVRFCQPIEGGDMRYWYQLLGGTSVNFAVCSPNGRVLAALDLDIERGNSRRVLQIKQSVLGACRVRYLRCPLDNLPSVAELQLLVPTSDAAARSPQPAAPLPSPEAAGASAPAAERRAERSALWKDSSIFQDSFFVPDGRTESTTGPGELAPLLASAPAPVVAEYGQVLQRRASDRDPNGVGGVVVDTPEFAAPVGRHA